MRVPGQDSLSFTHTRLRDHCGWGSNIVRVSEEVCDNVDVESILQALGLCSYELTAMVSRSQVPCKLKQTKTEHGTGEMGSRLQPLRNIDNSLFWGEDDKEIAVIFDE